MPLHAAMFAPGAPRRVPHAGAGAPHGAAGRAPAAGERPAAGPRQGQVLGEDHVSPVVLTLVIVMTMLTPR